MMEDEIIKAVETMVNEWSIETLVDYVVEERAEYYLGKSVSEEEVKELLNNYGE